MFDDHALDNVGYILTTIDGIFKLFVDVLPLDNFQWVAILVKQPATRTHHEVGSDQIGLPGGAEAFLAPAAAAGHHPVDFLDRQLGDQHGDHHALVRDGGGDEGIGDELRV